MNNEIYKLCKEIEDGSEFKIDTLYTNLLAVNASTELSTFLALQNEFPQLAKQSLQNLQEYLYGCNFYFKHKLFHNNVC